MGSTPRSFPGVVSARRCERSRAALRSRSSSTSRRTRGSLEPIEVAAYYVASEALANATKHAQASRVDVSLATRNRSLLLSIRDNGVGGADPARGSGLVGLTDRVEALGGSIRVRSRPGDGTHITAELPLEPEPVGEP